MASGSESQKGRRRVVATGISPQVAREKLALLIVPDGPKTEARPEGRRNASGGYCGSCPCRRSCLGVVQLGPFAANGVIRLVLWEVHCLGEADQTTVDGDRPSWRVSRCTVQARKTG